MKSRLAILSTITLLFGLGVAAANDLSVDRHTLRAGESLSITVSLEDDFASLDEIRVPVRNLQISDTPSVSSEFSFINGTVVRRKVFRFAARASLPGPAQVGPLTLSGPGGQRETFAAIVLQVLPDRAAASNDPSTVLRELLAGGRDPFFVVAEMDHKEVLLGEQVVVTWWLYNAAAVQQWQIGAVPKLSDFWVEEVDIRNAQPVQTFVGDMVMQRMPVRRVALFPLRSGELPVGPMEIEAAVMRQSGGGPFGLFEGNMVDVSFSSAPLSVRVHPLPPGAAPLVGELSLTCSPPRQKGGGPVLIEAKLSGHGNVRSAPAPRFETEPAADVQLVERGTAVDRSAIPSMTRRWQFLLFPARTGVFDIPSMALTTFWPSAGANRTLRCQGSTLTVSAMDRSQPRTETPPGRSPALAGVRPFLLWILCAAAAVLMARPLWRVLTRRRGLALSVRQILDYGGAAEIREAVHRRLYAGGLEAGILMRESSDRGDAYRSLRSLLDALEHERMSADRTELRRRLRELLEFVQSTP